MKFGEIGRAIVGEVTTAPWGSEPIVRESERTTFHPYHHRGTKLLPSPHPRASHPWSHDSLHDPPNIFPSRLSSSIVRRLARFHQAPSPPLLRLRSFHPPPSPAFTFSPSKACEILLSFSFRTSNLSVSIRELWREESTIPENLYVCKHGTEPKERYLCVNSSNKIYPTLPPLPSSFSIERLFYNRNLVTPSRIITRKGIFNWMDGKHGFIKLLCRRGERLTNAICPRHAFNSELGKYI